MFLPRPREIGSEEALECIHNVSVLGLCEGKSRFVEIDNGIRLVELVKAVCCVIE